MATLSRDTIQGFSAETVKQMREEGVPSVEYIGSAIAYEEFFLRFLMPNRPCVFGPDVTRNWRSIQDWVLPDGKPDFHFLHHNFGNAVVPVADCKRVEYSAQPKTEMTLSEYLSNWQMLGRDGDSRDGSCLYLKDWHFRKMFPNYEAYTTPIFFSSDWMNEYWDARTGPATDDYRFVYMGPKGSWTPFHADVFRSYSWSANVCGRKRWLLYPPGQEEKLRDGRGNMVYDLTATDLADPAKYPRYPEACRPFEVVQGPGEVIFVPSGWHHQVFNIEDTISINHNWLNGCNVDLSWSFLKRELTAVQESIRDCVDMDGWHSQCQLIMKANTGIDYGEFLQLLWTIAKPRLQYLQDCGNASVGLSQGKCEETDEDGECSCESSSHPAPGTDCERGTRSASGHCATCQRRTQTRLHGDTTDPSALSLLPADAHEQNLGDKSSHKWHLMFDLRRIREILASMTENQDFCLLERASLCKDPHELIREIDRATMDVL